jgi:hypothetical protein
VIVHGWSVASGLASPRHFNLVGFTWTKLVRGVTIYFGVSPAFVVFLALWRVA